MKKIENQCCDCAVPGYPCRGSICEYRHVTVYYCDNCGEELEEIFRVDDEDLCECCLKEKFRKDIEND